jgi:hypothetical protein
LWEGISLLQGKLIVSGVLASLQVACRPLAAATATRKALVFQDFFLHRIRGEGACDSSCMQAFVLSEWVTTLMERHQLRIHNPPLNWEQGHKKF